MLFPSLIYLTSCAILGGAQPHSIGAAPSAITFTNTTASDTTPPILTTDNVAQVTTFVGLWAKEPKAVFDSAKAHMITFKLQIGAYIPAAAALSSKLPMMPMGNFVELARIPSVAADFKAAGISPEDYIAVRKSLIFAVLTDGVDRGMHGGTPTVDTASVIGRNVQFVRAHPAAIDSLKKLGAPFPELKINASPAQQGNSLNP